MYVPLILHMDLEMKSVSVLIVSQVHIYTASRVASLLDRVNPELVSCLYIFENISYEFAKVRN